MPTVQQLLNGPAEERIAACFGLPEPVSFAELASEPEPEPEPVKGRACEDCGEEIEPNRRRRTCLHCGLKVCGWCLHHVHGLPSCD